MSCSARSGAIGPIVGAMGRVSAIRAADAMESEGYLDFIKNNFYK
jgi:hypothetical protein